MGKRKQRPDLNKTPPSDVNACSSRMDSLSKEKSSRSANRHAPKSLSSIMDIMENSMKRSSTRQSHQNPSRLTKPRNYYGHQYSRRKASNVVGASSSSHAKSDEKTWMKKVTAQCDFDTGNHKEKEKAFCGREKTRTSSYVADAASTRTETMACGLCEKSLKRKPYAFKNGISSGDLSVVAVLVCGHVYHADCLEQITRHDNIQDPLCPLCVGPVNLTG